MALVLIEEVLVGLEAVYESLAQAVTILADVTEDLTPDLANLLKERLETGFLQPLQSCSAMLETLLEEIATL
jgi:hypothetical protein